MKLRQRIACGGTGPSLLCWVGHRSSMTCTKTRSCHFLRPGAFYWAMNEPELRRVISGEPDAIRDLVREYAPLLRAVVRRRLPSIFREMEEDILQDIFCELFKNGANVLRTWDPARGRSLRTFLVVFAEKQILNGLRERARTSAHERLVDTAILDESVIGLEPRVEPHQNVETARILELLMGRFRERCTPQEWTVFDMFYRQERSAEEVAQALNVNVDAVYVSRMRVRKRLMELRDELFAAERVR